MSLALLLAAVAARRPVAEVAALAGEATGNGAQLTVAASHLPGIGSLAVVADEEGRVEVLSLVPDPDTDPGGPGPAGGDLPGLLTELLGRPETSLRGPVWRTPALLAAGTTGPEGPGSLLAVTVVPVD